MEERIETTAVKAKAVRPLVEKMITLGKKGDLAARRQAAAYLMTDAAVTKLFDTVAPRFGDRQGGYLRIVRTAWRKGDGADTAFIELLGSEQVLDEKRQVGLECRFDVLRQPAVVHRTGKAVALHAKRLPADPAKRHRLWCYARQAIVADRSKTSAQKRPATRPAIRRKNSGYNIIQNSPKYPARTSQHPRDHAPFPHPTGWHTGQAPWRGPGFDFEHTAIQAYAEDTPHSLALQVGRTAPCPQYKPFTFSTPINIPLTNHCRFRL